MRTTIRLDDDLLARLKTYSARTGTTLNAVVADAVRAYLAATRRRPGAGPPRLTTVGGRGVRPGVNLDDSAGLLDLMEGE